ncbi:MAG: hypothetical protein P8N76_25560 [Pirellulaceae bacterium]|nr:hypothetical protein [Pirellulaceae bacterium]
MVLRILHFARRWLRYRSPERLPSELKELEEVHISDKHHALMRRHGAFIKAKLDQQAPDDSDERGVRKSLGDTTFLETDIAKIANSYEAQVIELTVFRLLETQQSSDRGKKTPAKGAWISELWHADNYPPDAFKILIYLTDVGEDNGPFEYLTPVQYHPPDSSLSWRDTRIANPGHGHKVTGPAGTTIIFKSNIPHKGNYCRTGHRDVIMIGLSLPGPLRRLKRKLAPLVPAFNDPWGGHFRDFRK